MENQTNPYFVGVDIGTTAVRCVVGELGLDETSPSIVGFSESSNSGMRRGNVAHVDEVVAALVGAINEAERMSGKAIKSATVNVNGSHIQGLNSRGVIAISSSNREITDDDRLRAEEAATIVQLPPNKEIIQVFAKNYRLDNQDNIKDPVGMHGVRLEVDTHIVVASTPALKSLDQVLNKADLFAAHRTVSGLAAAEAVLDRKLRDSGCVVLDIGATTTNMLVIEDGEIEHVAVVPMGGMHVTNDLAIGLKVDLELAELVKLKHANIEGHAEGETTFVHEGQQHHFERKLMKMIVEARLEELFEYVDKELKRIHRSRKLPGGAILVGGGSKLPGLVNFTKEELQLPVKLGSLSRVNQVVGGMDELAFSNATGLMLLDMLLGPPQGYDEVSTGLLSALPNPFKKLRPRRKKH